MRKLVLAVGVIGALLVFVFFLAGTPLVLRFVGRKIETAVKESTGMSLVIGRLKGNLFYNAQLEGVDLANTIHIEKLRVRYNPIRLLKRQVDIKSVQITGLHVDFDRLDALIKNLPKKTEKKSTEAPTFVINIRQFSIKNSGFAGKFGKAELSVSLAARGNLAQEKFGLDSLCLRTERSQFIISGTIPLNEQNDLVLGYEMKIAAEELGIPDLRGDIQGHGSVGGKLSAIALQTILEFDVRYLENKLNGHVAVDWLLPDLDDLNFAAQLHALSPPLRKDDDRPDSWNLDLKIRNSNLDCAIQSNRGDLRVRGVLKSDLTRPYFRGMIQGHVDYADFEPSFNGQIYYRNDMLELSAFELLSRRATLDLSLLLDTRTRKILKTDLDLSCSDLSVVNDFVRYPPNIKGKLSCQLRGSGFLDNPTASAKLSMSDVVIYGENIASAFFDLSMRDRVAKIDSGIIASMRGKVMLAGSYGLKKKDFTANLQSDGIFFESPEVFGTATLPLGGTVGLDLTAEGNVHVPRVKGKIFINGLVYDSLEFGDYALECQLADDTLQFSFMSIEGDLVLSSTMILGGSFPCVADLKLHHYALDRYVKPTAGFVTAEISAEGELMHVSEAAGTMRVDTVLLEVEGKPIENVEAVIVQLRDRAIHLRSCEFVVAGQRVSLHGSMPFDFESRVIDLSLSSSDIQLSDISYLLPLNSVISGGLRFDLRIQGKPKALDIDGQLSLTNGKYEISNVNVDSVYSLLSFRNGVVTIERFSGRVNKGQFSINGFANLSRGLLDTLSLAIAVDRFDYSSKDFGSFVCNADMQVSAHRDSMRIGGEITIIEAVYDKPIRLQTLVGLLTKVNRPAPQQSEFSSRTYCDIGIVVPDSIRITNNVADVSAKADLQLKGYLAHLNAYGTITALDEGTIQYLGKKFTIVNAVIQFDDPYKIDPVIDLTATTTIATAEGDYEIFLALDGTVNTWQLGLNSNPPLPEQDIVSLILIGQRRPGGVGGMAKEMDLKGKVKDYALDMVRHNIEKTTEEALGFDKFTLTGDLSKPTTMRIGIEKSIAKGFTLHYSTGLESWELYQVGASYDLTNKISIFTMYDQENRNTSVDLDFHIKIR
jgi:autotransporter translocation and assembly factor TamB